MYTISRTKGFKKAVKLCLKRGKDMNKLQNVVDILAENGMLPEKYRPHKLSSKFNFAWECHIEPDWLLLWEQDDENLILLFTNTGTHSDIFG